MKDRIKINIEIIADNDNGISNSLREVTRIIEKGYYSGMDSNEEEEYSFERTNIIEEE